MLQVLLAIKDMEVNLELFKNIIKSMHTTVAVLRWKLI